ncbi:MAG TPA: CehA/McbA family metallohydrolase [Pirellulales bacterium]|nr:CehA/McbA family metallohydrolase [Pirellulales bacterium]
MLRFLTQLGAWVVLAGISSTAVSTATERVLDPQFHHLRSGEAREWSDFPAAAEGPELKLTFAAEPNAAPYTLRLRQRDVKQTWRLRINDQELGRLSTDENPLTTFWELQPGALRAGDNVLSISGSGPTSDDVFVGDVRLIDLSRADALRQATVSVTATDADSGRPLPARLTIVDEHDSLCSVGAESSLRLAVRPGVVYTADGRAEFGLPAGKYRLYAGRGFEYGIDEKTIELAVGDRRDVRLAIRREVSLPGYASCDTHLHTFTYSRHGDATLEERMVTLAAEGLELPVAADHNVQIDYEAAAAAAGVRRYFSPLVGDEVTTKLGHFNVFPLDPAAAPIAHEGGGWPEIFAAIRAGGGRRAIVLNHPRDIHSGFRPFDPRRHLAIAGENLDGWRLEANAMELVNSGALQSDPWRLVHDWLGLLNAGLKITPVGASDSHDVARSIVGQARTYVRCRDEDPGRIDAAEAVHSFLAGCASVSFGLAADVAVDGRYGPGDLVPAGAETLRLDVRVWGPSWSKAEEIVLFVNGGEVRRESIPADRKNLPGLKYEAAWTLAKPPHDAHLVVVAIGPGIAELYWPTPRPYQPDSPDWRPSSLAATGAVWLDADGRPGFTAAGEYAERLIEQADGDAAGLVKELSAYDEAVAVQAAALLRRRGELFRGATLEKLLAAPSPATRAGVRKYVEAWKQSEAAREKGR